MKIKRAVLAPLTIATVALATGGWFLQRGVSREGNVYTQARLFEEVLHRISDDYVDAKDPSSLYKMAIDGLIHELGDPYTAFMTPDDYKDLKVTTQGEYGGIGSEITKRDGWVTILAPLPGSPSERAGLHAGDKIVEIDGVSTKGWSQDDAVAKLRGPKGSVVEFKVARSGMDELIPFRLVREEIQVKSVRTSYLMPDGVGYIELRVFSENTTGELRAAINDLRNQGLKGLIIDVRGNPGGLLDQAISSSDLFLKRGQPVSELRGRVASMNQKFVAQSPDQFPNLPVVVLTGPQTASASEILAGALQDHDRALVVGQTTFGKGLVQTLFQLPAGHWLKLTTARWYTPVGRSIQSPHAMGMTPEQADVLELESEEKPLAERESFRTDGGRIVYGGGGITPDLIIEPDKFTDSEVEFLKAVQKHGSKFYDLLYKYALDYHRQHPELRPGFAVTPALLDGFYQLLNANEVPVTRELFDGARRWLGQELGYQVTYARWSPQEARKRANAEDPQVKVAVELLRSSGDPQALFRQAEQYAAARKSTQEQPAGQAAAAPANR
jgi:carboxyl-terminal processing protease